MPEIRVAWIPIRSSTTPAYARGIDSAVARSREKMTLRAVERVRRGLRQSRGSPAELELCDR
jgi:hypothetical protein